MAVEPEPEARTQLMAQLKVALDSGADVRLARAFPENEFATGRVVGLSDTLVLLRRTSDFRVDGFALSRVRHLNAVERRPAERFFEFVMRAEGRTAQLVSSPDLDLEDMVSALHSLLEHEPVMAVECEGRLDELERPDYTVGRLLGLDDTHALMGCINVDGSYDPEPWPVELAHITLIEFDTDYLRLFAKYGDWGVNTPKH